MSKVGKPAGCLGCPLYGDGTGYVPAIIREQAPLMIMAQNPGEDEEKGRRIAYWAGGAPVYEECKPQPMIGKTGHDLKKNYLPLTGLGEEDASWDNVIRCRWRGTNKMPPDPILRKAADHCWKAHFRRPEGAKLIVTSGVAAMWACTGKGTPSQGIETWRGWMAPLRPPFLGTIPDTDIYVPRGSDLPVLMTTHIAALYRDPTSKMPTRMDWSKVARILANKWPLAMPTVRRHCEPGMWEPGSAFDTEWNMDTRELLRYSLFTPSGKLYVIEAGSHIPAYVPTDTLHMIFQNAPADLEDATRMGLTVDPEDTMLAHSVLWSGMPHDLDFLGSIYGPLNRWKHLSRVNPIDYAAGDAMGTWYIWKQLKAELDRDPGSKWIYEHAVRPLIPIILKARQKGLRVNRERVARVRADLAEQIEDIKLRAQAHVGWPINLASPKQVSHWLYEVEQVGMPRRTPFGQRNHASE